MREPGRRPGLRAVRLGRGVWIATFRQRTPADSPLSGCSEARVKGDGQRIEYHHARMCVHEEIGDVREAGAAECHRTGPEGLLNEDVGAEAAQVVAGEVADGREGASDCCCHRRAWSDHRDGDGGRCGRDAGIVGAVDDDRIESLTFRCLHGLHDERRTCRSETCINFEASVCDNS